MKRFIIIGAILAGAAVCVLIAHQKVFTVTNVGPGSGSKYMKIKVDTRTGMVKSKKNEDEVAAEEVSKQVFDRSNPTSVAEIFWSHTSPGCVWIVIGGNYYRICY
jgi:hypothetical protein